MSLLIIQPPVILSADKRSRSERLRSRSTPAPSPDFWVEGSLRLRARGLVPCPPRTSSGIQVERSPELVSGRSSNLVPTDDQFFSGGPIFCKME
jgi:hypothetical protein